MVNPLNVDFITSRDSYMRTGKLIFIDDMEDLDAAGTVHWQTSWTGHAGTIGKDNTRAFSGANSLKLTTGANAADYVQCMRRTSLRKLSSDPGLPIGTFGLEFKWMTEDALATITSITVELDVFDGTNKNMANIVYLTTGSKWQYLNNVGALTDIPSGGENILLGTSDVWQYFKMISEVWRGTYGYVMSNNKMLLKSLSGTTIYKPADATYGNIQVVIGITAAGAAAVHLFIDDVILTYDEEFK